MAFPHGSAVKESACNVGDLGSIPWLGGSPGEGKSYSLQYSGLMIPWTVVRQAPLSMDFSRLEYWSGLLFPTLGDLPN